MGLDKIGGGMITRYVPTAIALYYAIQYQSHYEAWSRSLLKRHINAATMYFFTSHELLYVMFCVDITGQIKNMVIANDITGPLKLLFRKLG